MVIIGKDKMMTKRIRIYVDGEEWIPDDYEPDEVITEIKMWYDRHERSWRVWAENRDGYQVGDAKYVYSKQEAIWVRDNWNELNGKHSQ